MSRIVLAMSGGVDSSVAAYLLRQEGHEVIGIFMRHGEASPAHCGADTSPSASALPIIEPAHSPHQHGCCTAADAHDARRVADALDIPFYAIDFRHEFGRIIDYFVDEYRGGRTPNPCVVCNNWLKFGKLWEYARSIDAEYIATGHYAQVCASGRQDELPALRKGIDATKDQSYVLFGIDRQLLPMLNFPVGGYRKTEIRRIAAEIGMRVAEKKDSQEICFVPDRDYAGFIRRRAQGDDRSGEIVTTGGAVVGHHDGVERFTVGQRKGLRVALGERRYVLRIDSDSRRVVIGHRDELAKSELEANGANWLVDPPPRPFRCDVKIRYNSRPVPAIVECHGNDRLAVRFDEPQYGVSPGQAVVSYEGDRVLGGGWIK